MSSSSKNLLSHPYHRQSQSRSPSFQSSSSSHPIAAPPAPPVLEPSLVHPGISQNLGVPARGISNLVDPTTSPVVPRLTGTDLGGLTQQGPARSGVRGVRSFSSPPLAIGLNTGLSDSSLYPGSDLGVQSASASGVSCQSRGRLSAPTNPWYAWISWSPVWWISRG